MGLKSVGVLRNALLKLFNLKGKWEKQAGSADKSVAHSPDGATISSEARSFVRDRGSGGSPSGVLRSKTVITMARDNREKGRLELMFQGKPAFYWLDVSNPSNKSMLEMLRRSHEEQMPVEVEWNPFSLQILRVSPVFRQPETAL